MKGDFNKTTYVDKFDKEKSRQHLSVRSSYRQFPVKDQITSIAAAQKPRQLFSASRFSLDGKRPTIFIDQLQSKPEERGNVSTAALQFESLRMLQASFMKKGSVSYIMEDKRSLFQHMSPTK